MKRSVKIANKVLSKEPTPGSWTVRLSFNNPLPEKDHYVITTRGLNDPIIAKSYSTEANAKLIACAPDMLSVLERLEWLEVGDQLGGGDIEAIRAVIAKAVGAP